MASGKAKSIDELNMMEIFGAMEALGVSFEGVITLDEMRSRVRTALNQAEKTSSWSAGQVRVLYFFVKFQNERILTCFKQLTQERHFNRRKLMRGQGVRSLYCQT